MVSPHISPTPSLLPTPPILRSCASVSWPVNRSPPSLVSRARAYASASALQVVLWRVRDFVMLPRAARLWAAFLAYAVLLAAVYLGQAAAAAPAGSRVRAAGAAGGELRGFDIRRCHRALCLRRAPAVVARTRRSDT